MFDLPAITPEQERYWGETQEIHFNSTQEMPTAVPARLNVELMDVSEVQIIEKEEQDKQIELVNLGDSMSPTRRDRISELLSGLYVPPSPEGGRKIKGDVIVPVALDNKKPDTPRRLSPEAKPFVPAKRLSTTTVSDLEARSQYEEIKPTPVEIRNARNKHFGELEREARARYIDKADNMENIENIDIDFDLSGTIKPGDDASSGLNFMELDSEGDLWDTLTEERPSQGREKSSRQHK